MPSSGCEREPRELHIDLETYSDVDLRECGVYAYASSPAFEILLIAYAFGEDPVRQVSVAEGEGLPEELLSALLDKSVLKIAHNATFERVCLSIWMRRNGLLPEGRNGLGRSEWFCTSVRAAELGMPRSLEGAGAAMGLPSDKAKLTTGRALIAYFCVPCKPTKSNGGRTRNLPHHDQERWHLFKAYNAQDVVAEREIYRIEQRYPHTVQRERELYALDQQINDEGVAVDMDLIDKIEGWSEGNQRKALERAKQVTGMDNPNSLEQAKAWLRRKGVEAESLDRDAVKALADHPDPEVAEYARIRLELGKTSVAKYDAMKRSAVEGPEGIFKVRGMLMFYGAMRTGRWAGRIVQLQNLPRNSIKDLGVAREMAERGDFGLVGALYGSPMDVLSQLVRTAFVPEPGNVFCVADYNAIEARVIAWLAGERWKLDVFEHGGKVYEETASRMFGIPADQIAHDSPERAKGKVAELAGGYGGGKEAYRRMGAEAYGWSEKEIERLVQTWRDANPAIVDFWGKAQQAMTQAIKNPGTKVGLTRGIAFAMVGDTLFAQLPSGRCIAYKGAKLDKGLRGREEVVYLGEAPGTGKYGFVRSYGGKIVENLVQATARDCLAEAMLRLSAKGYKIRFHVHDECVIEVPWEEAEEALKDIEQVMALEGLAWKDGLPLRAEGYSCPYYVKE